MFGTILKSLRKQHKMTQSELAKKLKISASTVGMYEQNRRAPDNQTLNDIANIFSVSVDYLLGRTDMPMSLSFNNSSSNRSNELIEREPLKKLMEQVKDLPDKEIIRIMNIIKALELGEDIPGAIVEEIDWDE
ncbi:MAG: helix-turn-helix domain-containing protein [Cellulosilyticaceae bacterium]